MISFAEPPPNEAPLVLAGRDYLSYSAVSTYQECPLKFHFRYVLGLSEGVISSSLVMGSAIHAAIEAHYREQLHGNQTPTLAFLQQVYHQKWNEFDSQQIRFGKGGGRETLDKLAERILTRFQSSDMANVSGRILGIEEEFRGAVIAGCPEMLARVDLVVDTGEAIVITDFKTAKARWSAAHVDEAAGQLLLYHELVKPLADGRPVRLEFAVITKTKSPELVRYPVPVDQQQINRVKRTISRVWEAVESGLFFPSPSLMNCGGCPFRKPCREWSG